MKTAFVTFYEFKNDVYRFYNGFSFISHLYNNEFHFFMNTSNENLISLEQNRLKNELKYFNKIYVTIAFIKHLKYIYPILDERFVIGGPGALSLNSEKLYQTTKAILIKKDISFESFINVPIQEKFTHYWRDHFDTNKQFFYNITSSTTCPFNCKFCTFSPSEKINRDLNKIFDVYKNDIMYFTNPSFGIKDFDYFKNNLQMVKDKNLEIVFFTRSDKIIQDKLKEFSDLSNFNFFIGLEFLSNDCLKRMNKTSTVENFLDILNVIFERKGKVTIGFLLNSPVFTKNDLDVSLENLNKLKNLYKSFNKKYINCAVQEEIYFINDFNTASTLSNKIKTYKMCKGIDDNEVYILQHQTSEDQKYNAMFSEIFLKEINYINKGWKFI